MPGAAAEGTGASFIRFLLVGGTGFLIDAGLTLLLIRVGMAPWQARVPAILSAMAFTWLANRRFTYRHNEHATLAEAGRYAGVAAVMALGNYLLFIGLSAWSWPPLAAVIVATACQTIVSFWAYKSFVFRRST
jgi:putative flippase GtrA